MSGSGAGLIWREMAELSAGDGAIIRSGKTQQCDNHHHNHCHEHCHDYHDCYDHQRDHCHDYHDCYNHHRDDEIPR